MIPVRIAALLTAEGIDGVRWVLVDAEDSAVQAEVAAVPVEPMPGQAATQRRRLRWLLQAAVVAAALLAAALTTRALLIRFDARGTATVPAAGNAAAARPTPSLPALVSDETSAASWLSLAPSVPADWLPGSPAAAVVDIVDASAPKATPTPP